MVELRVLGLLQLSASDGRKVESLARRSRRAALLAFLAVALPRGPQRRDKLLALFWPELDTLRARNALNQALHVLRSALGDRAIRSGGDGEVGLDPTEVWCDVVAFEAALDAGRPAEALTIYRGDLLDGFFISGAPEFEHWVDQQRERLRHRASEAAWMLAETKATEGNTVEAARWARQSADLLPADEAVLRRLVKFLYELGDRAAAIRAYEAFAWRLAQEYELSPSAETAALVEAIRSDVSRTVSQERFTPRSIPPTTDVTGNTSAPVRSRVGAAVLMAALLIVGAGTWLGSREASRAPLVRFALEFADAPPLASGVPGSAIAVSPDGQQLVYVGTGLNGPRLFVRRMDRLEVTPIPNTRGASLPFFSPDGEWLGFLVGTSLRKMRLAGGPAITICSVTESVSGASWGPNDVIVFATPAGLWRAPAGGGEAALLALADTVRGERYRWPEVLPGGHAVVFTRVHDAKFHLAVLSLQTGAVQPLGLEGTSPRFVPPDNLVFATMGGALLTVSFDEHTLRHTGGAIPLAEDVHVGMAGAAKLGLAGTGTLAYVARPTEQSLVLVDRHGRAESVPVAPHMVGDARFSADGGRIALAIRPIGGEESIIWVLDLVANTLRRATVERGSLSPVWSPDAARIAFARTARDGRPGFGIRWTAPDEMNSAEALLATPALGQLPVAFTPDSRALVFQRRDPHTLGDIWVLSLEGQHEATPYLRGPSDERAAALSPDGRWLAYVSDESGRDEVYVRSFPDPGAPVRVSADGGSEPRWAKNGRELFYRAEQGMVATEIATAPALRVGSHTVLFDDDDYIAYLNGPAYDVRPDGQRFAMIRRGTQSRDVIVVLNAFDDLHLGHH